MNVTIWRTSRIALLTASMMAIAACGGSGSSSTPATATISVLSSRPDMVSDDSALVQVAAPAGTDMATLKVISGTTDVTSQLRQTSGGTLIGVVRGLARGSNQLSVVGSAEAKLTLINHAKDAPIIAGPQQSPWICMTDTFNLLDGSNLGAPQDRDCNAPTKVIYVYKARNATGFKPLTSTNPLPADLATTVTTEGRTVNYIVRLETGTLNRGIYQFAVLYDPTKEAAPEPTGTYQGWNRKLVYYYGGSLAAGYIQGNSNILVLADYALSRGFSVISSTLNGYGNNPSTVLSAEVTSKVKERFIKTFGAPLYTIGWGLSGGSMAQHTIANAYPGLHDGIVPGQTYTDMLSTIPHATDCALLERAFNAGGTWADAQKTAVSGFFSFGACNSQTVLSWNRLYAPSAIQAARSTNPRVLNIDFNNCRSELPAAQLYDPVANPSGARCDVYSGQVNTIGIDPGTGYPARGLDNVGVQYGLKPYLAGTISPEQFVQLNEVIGGYDGDGRYQAQRTVASTLALNNMYQYGLYVTPTNLANIPIVDYRGYSDQTPDIHNAVHSMSMRARLIKANGSADNQVILRSAGPAIEGDIITALDQWVSAIRSDTRSHASIAAKVIANKPPGFSDACYAANGGRIAETADIDNGGRCGQLVPFYSTPRMVAGAPLADDVAKCQLKALVRSDYDTLSDPQFARLSAVFPAGVCDYTRASVGQLPLKGTWLSFTSPGVGVPLN